MLKIKVFANHRQIGWLRLLAGEVVVSPSLARATTFGADNAGAAMADFIGPEPATSKAPAPVVTFQLLKV